MKMLFIILVLLVSGCTRCNRSIVSKTIKTIGKCSDWDNYCKVLFMDDTSGMVRFPVIGEQIKESICISMEKKE